MAKEKKTASTPWHGIVWAGTTIISSSFLADGLKGEALFSCWNTAFRIFPYPLVFIFLSLVLFLFSAYRLNKHKEDFMTVKVLSQGVCSPHPCLIILLTKSNMPLPEKLVFPYSFSKGNIKVQIKGQNIDEDIAELEKLKVDDEFNYWNWQQLLRGIEPHVQIKKIFIVGSPKKYKDSGSFALKERARDLLSAYTKLPDDDIEFYDKAVDFENYEEVKTAINEIIKKLKTKKWKAKDIVVDITGGQKTASVAAASITFRDLVTFQYVQTSSPYAVVAYDVINQASGDSGGL
jgi:hypothetical protein